ncbi:MULTISPECIES: tetratricopeptide repeat protein [unclassified Streptomyces]|uniref:tetratricopeptide repeat protein n=1 Tax=unclassified Streptomyces TaxID=2593676 RepID=UPI000367F295|nr:MULTISPECIES: tetratricopeptide repeat protein [unclassified Streptomyces]MYY02267.1 tetratricopeptide repeat protein [Streptomyces sp. SID4913]
MAYEAGMVDDEGHEPAGTALCVVCEEYADERSFPRLTGAVAQMEGIAELLEGLGIAARVVDSGNPSWAAFEQALTAWSEEWRGSGAPKPAVIVWSGHGVLVDGELRLALSDLDLDADQVTRETRALRRGVAAETLVNEAVASGADQILLVIDTCHAGDAVGRGLEKALRRWEAASMPPGRVQWFGIMASCRRGETSDGDGPLLDALTEVLKAGPATTEYRSAWSAHNAWISGPDLLAALGERWRGEGQTPVPATVGTGRPVFPNPRHVPGAPARLVEHLVLAARGVGYREEGWFFTGRKEVLGRIVSWLEADEAGLFLVTGPAGCGKSAVLGRIATLTDPVQREETEARGGLREDDPDPGPRPGRSLASVHLRGLSPLQAASELARQLGLPEPRNTDDFRGELRELPRQPVLVLDGLDEVPAEHLRAMIEELVFPLGRAVPVLLGSRERAFRSRLSDGGHPDETLPDALARLIGAGVVTADLEREPHTQEDIAAYVFRRCAAAGVPEDRAREVGDAVASRATAVDGGFLFARLVTGSLLARGQAAGEDGWQDGLPGSIEAAFEDDLRAGPVRALADGTELPSAARDLLTALAWTVGRGMPAGGVWEEVAGALGGRDVPYDESDVDWVLSAYGRYIVEDSESGQAVYRLYHREFVSHLADRPVPGGGEAAEVVLAALAAHAERRTADGGRQSVDPYVVRGLSRHAVRAGEPGIGMLRGLAERVGPSAVPVLAQALHGLSERLGREGDLDGALEAAREAAVLYGALEEAAPGSCTTSLVHTLVSVANRCADIGDREGALAPAREAVALQRKAAEAGGSASWPDLALALATLGRRVHDIGDREEGLTLTRAATGIFRELAEEEPAAFRPRLAASLTNLAVSLAAVGERRAAVEPAQEAVRLHTELAASHPDEFLAPLASSLTNLAYVLKAVGRQADALPHAEAAVRVNRKVAERHPTALRAALQGSLTNLSEHRADTGDLAGSLAPAREAVDICRELVSRHPDAFRQDLAASLHNLAERISATGDHEGALAPAREAARMFAGLAKEHPDVFQPDLARTLTSLANKTATAGDRASGVLLAREAVRIQRDLVRNRPTASAPGLAAMLNNLAMHLGTAGEPGEALPHSEEAVALYGHLATEDRDAFLAEFAVALNNLGNFRATLGDMSGALAAGREAVTIRRELAAQQPAVFRQELATSLANLAAHLNRAGEPAEGLRASEEGVALLRELVADAPVLRSSLAGSLGTLAQNLAHTGSPQEALTAAEEGVLLWRGLADEQSGAHLPDLALALRNLGKLLGMGQDLEGAVGTAREAVTAYRALALTDPRAFAGDLLHSLGDLAHALARTDDHDAAVAAFDAVVAEFATVHPATARRLGVERSIFLLDCPGTRPSDGVRELVSFLGGDSGAEEDDGPDVVTVRARRALRAHGDAEAVRAAWEAETFGPVPDWLGLSQETLDLVSSWLFAPDWPTSRDVWSRNTEVLGGEETATALEELALLDARTAQRHAALRELVLAHGVTAAYDPLILSEQLAEWVGCESWAESRAFLQDHPRLLGVRPSPDTPLSHVALLDVSRAEGMDAAYRLVEDRDALHAYVERAMAAGDGNALMTAAAIEGQVFNDQLSSLTHAQAGMVLAGAVEGVEPSELAILIPRSREEIRVRLLREIAGLSVQHAHPHGELWLRMVQALSGAA